MVSYSKKLCHLASKLTFLKTFLSSHPTRQFLITNRILPMGSTYVSVLFVYCKVLLPGHDPSFDTLHDAFITGTDTHKNDRLKYLAQLPTAPFIVKSSVQALGGYRPVIMGKG